jgi:hypothetical protein
MVAPIACGGVSILVNLFLCVRTDAPVSVIKNYQLSNPLSFLRFCNGTFILTFGEYRRNEKRLKTLRISEIGQP